MKTCKNPWFSSSVLFTVRLKQLFTGGSVMYKMSSQQLAAIKKDYTVREAYIPEPEMTEEERAEMDRMDRLYERDEYEFAMIDDLLTEDFVETEEYIESLREISGLY